MASRTHPLAEVGPQKTLSVVGFVIDLLVAVSVFMLLTGFTFGRPLQWVDPNDVNNVMTIPRECLIVPWVAFLHFLFTRWVSKWRPRDVDVREGEDPKNVEKMAKFYARIDVLGNFLIISVIAVAVGSLFVPPVAEIIRRSGAPAVQFTLTAVVTFVFFFPLTVAHLIEQIYRGIHGWEGVYGTTSSSLTFEPDDPQAARQKLRVEADVEVVIKRRDGTRLAIPVSQNINDQVVTDMERSPRSGFTLIPPPRSAATPPAPDPHTLPTS